MSNVYQCDNVTSDSALSILKTALSKSTITVMPCSMLAHKYNILICIAVYFTNINF